MSFGYSVGDFLVVGQLCWKVYKKCKDSPGNYAELSNEVGVLHNVIKETEELLNEQDLTVEQKTKVATSRQGCEEVLKDLDGLLVKYESLGTNSRRTFDRMSFGMQDMNSIRLRLILNMSMLDAFNNTSSHARLETKLNLLIAEVRAGKREGSVISTQTFDTTARNDQETWEALRRELEDIGLSPGIITEKRQFIITWFQEAVAAGKLEEDALSDHDDRAVSLYESDDLAGTSDEDSAPDRQISTMTIEPHTTKPNTNKESRPSAPRLSRQPADVSNFRSRQEKGRSQSGENYLMDKLRGREQQFLKAAKAGDVSMIQKMLGKGVDIQSQGLQGHETDMALHLASWYGSEAAVRLLLFEGADIHAKNKIGMTALHRAAYGGHKQVLELLLKKGADIHAKDIYGWTALHHAAYAGHEQVLELLLENGAGLESKTLKGYTALMTACKERILVVRSLLKNGADVHAKCNKGRTALHQAAYYDNEQVVELLLENGAGLESRTSSGSTALLTAARYGHLTMVQSLLKKGADVDVKDADGWTALLCAAYDGNEQVLELLLEKGVDLESTTLNGSTALSIAALYGHLSMVRTLLKNRADIHAKSKKGWTALHYAAYAGHEQVLELLLENGAGLESKTSSGSTALMKADCKGHISVVRLLLDKGAKVHQINEEGQTALSLATNETVSQLLRKQGPDVQ